MDDDAVLAALKTVIDPEMGLDVVALGLVYGIGREDDGTVAVRLGTTSPSCPLGSFLCDEAAMAVRRAVPGAPSVTVALTTDPPWTPDRLSPEARRSLGWGEG